MTDYPHNNNILKDYNIGDQQYTVKSVIRMSLVYYLPKRYITSDMILLYIMETSFQT